MLLHLLDNKTVDTDASHFVGVPLYPIELRVS